MQRAGIRIEIHMFHHHVVIVIIYYVQRLDRLHYFCIHVHVDVHVCGGGCVGVRVGVCDGRGCKLLDGCVLIFLRL